jgi:hypothetical protein
LVFLGLKLAPLVLLLPSEHPPPRRGDWNGAWGERL